MATAKHPTTLSEAFELDAAQLAELGLFNSTVAIDSQLFIDPLLLERSVHPEFSNDAHMQYEQHFELVIRLLLATRENEDPAWVAARRALTFPEVPGTCLGYGAGGIRGTGLTGQLTERVLVVAKQIVDIGVSDPDLFVALSLFEEKIGPDKISDMATNVIFEALCAFNERMLEELRCEGEQFDYRATTGNFLVNPFEESRTPVILLPIDILRDLPVAKDWDEVSDAASQNAQLRDQVNAHIGEIFERKSRRSKARLKDEALSSAEAFEALLAAVRDVDAHPYDVENDPDGLVSWASRAEQYARNHPLRLDAARHLTLDDVFEVVRRIVEDFRHLVEHRGLNQELYSPNGRPRRERTAQKFFLAIAYAHCKANNLDIAPEMDTGNGKIDFKFSAGFRERVLVEIKLSTNSHTVGGYTGQLEEYRLSEETMRAIYLVIDVGSMGTKQERLIQVRNEARENGYPLSDLEFVDGVRRAPPSRL